MFVLSHPRESVSVHAYEILGLGARMCVKAYARACTRMLMQMRKCDLACICVRMNAYMCMCMRLSACA